MFSQSTKEAIKTGLALSLTMMVVHWLGWQKTSWAMLTVFVLSLTNVYGFSALKSQNRAVGTLLGAVVAFVILSLFSQSPLGFFVAILSFLSFCVYMGYDTKRGYLFNIAITVCLVITSAGIDSGAAGLSTAILRLQETLLGVVVFSLVYRLVWPVTTESEFYRIANDTTAKIEEALDRESSSQLDEGRNNFDVPPLDIKPMAKNVKLLSDLIALPSSKKTELAEKKAILQHAVKGLMYCVSELKKRTEGQSSVSNESLRAALIDAKSALNDSDEQAIARLRKLPTARAEQFVQDVQPNRWKGIAVALGVAITVIMMWLYLPVPGGALLPVFGLIIAVNVSQAPAKLATPVIMLYTVFAVSILAQYVLVFPTLTESWQLGVIFFFNVVVWYKLFELLNLGSLKVLMGNALINMVGSATELTPSYNIESPLMMLVFLFVVMAIVRFYALLFEELPSYVSLQPKHS